MECKDVHNKIEEFTSKELKGEEYLKMENHFKTCADCRKILDSHQRVKEELLKIQVPDPGEQYWNGSLKTIMKGIKEGRCAGREKTFLENIIELLFSKKGLVYTTAMFIAVLLFFSVDRGNHNFKNITLTTEDVALYTNDLELTVTSDDLDEYSDAITNSFLEKQMTTDKKLYALDEYISFLLPENNFNSDILSYDLKELSDEEFANLLKMIKKS